VAATVFFACSPHRFSSNRYPVTRATRLAVLKATGRRGAFAGAAGRDDSAAVASAPPTNCRRVIPPLEIGS
jgi:hypothetical protein